MNVSIEKATIEDTETIAALARRTFQETFEHVFNSKEELEEYLSNTFSVEKIQSSLANQIMFFG